MKYAVLGPTGMRVSRICLGTMTFGKPLDEAQSKNLVSYALDKGINLFDTANAYEGYDRSWGSSGGVAEDILGKALMGRRHDAVICTKFANPIGKGPLDAGLSARHLEAEVDKSLKRLRTDWIDLVLAHRWDGSVPVEEVWRTFDRWVRAGKVRSVGVSNWPAWRMAQLSEIAKTNGWAPVAVSSPKYSLMTRGIELEHVPCAVHYGVGLLTYQALEGGVLAGKYRRGQPPPAGSRAAEKPAWVRKLDDALFDKLEALEKLAGETGLSMSRFATAWALSRRGVVSLITGCRTSEQLDDAIAAVEAKFPAEHEAQLNSLFPPPLPFGGEQILYWCDQGWVLENLET